MANHIKLLAVFYLVFGGMGLCAVLFILGVTLLGSGAAFLDDPTAGMILGTIGMIGVLIAAVVTLPSLLAGWGLLKGRQWARLLTLILSFLNLAAFPFGTALGIYGIWALFQPEAVRHFESSTPLGNAPEPAQSVS